MNAPRSRETRPHRSGALSVIPALAPATLCLTTGATPAQSSTDGVIGVAIGISGLIMSTGLLLSIRKHRERKRLAREEGS